MFSLFFFSCISIRVLQKDASSVVGASWRCGVVTTLSGIAGIGLGRLLGREHASTPQSGVGAPRLLKRSLARLYYCCFGKGITRVYVHNSIRVQCSLQLIPTPHIMHRLETWARTCPMASANPYPILKRNRQSPP